MEMYPLEFAPILKEVVWGGRRLASLGKPLPRGAVVGESWEVVDLPGESGVVRSGPLRGRTLHDLLEEHEKAILGPVSRVLERFPLLVKFIDAQDKLSVQVHPDEEACSIVDGGCRPKSEGWYVVDAEPGAYLYVGVNEGTGPKEFKKAIANGTVEGLLFKVPVKAGQFISVPAGTVHAIGAGVLLCEVQQMSDTTYRLWDWERMDFSGRPRSLHVQEALNAMRCIPAGPPEVVSPASGTDGIATPHFVMEKIRIDDAVRLSEEGPIIVVGLKGKGIVAGGSGKAVLTPGNTVLIPASLREATVQREQSATDTDELEFLKISIPV